MKKFILLGSVFGLLSISPAYPNECNPKTTADLSARVAVEITNDNLIGTLATSSSDASLESISRQIKTTINQALAISKKYPSVRVKTGQTYTHPVYDQNNKKIKCKTNPTQKIGFVVFSKKIHLITKLIFYSQYINI
mgnify:CR=1 FL=1